MIRSTRTTLFAHVVAVAAMVSGAALAPHALRAQAANPVVGKWTIEYERGRRIENDEVTPIMGTGTLTVSMQRDSVVVELDASPRPDGTPVPRVTVTGAWRDGALVFVQKQRVQMQMNGESTSPEITLTWTVTAKGDLLAGTLARDLPGMQEPMPSTPVKGTRIAR